MAARETATPPGHSLHPSMQSQFLIIACDGVWDVMEDQEAADLVQRWLYGAPWSPAPGEAAVPLPDAGRVKTVSQQLVDEALKRGSSDNITALVVML